MNNKELKVKLGGLPAPFVIFGYAIIITSFMLDYHLWYVSILLLLIGLLAVTARDRMIFNFDDKTLYKYSTFLFFKKGETIDLSKTEYISMVRVNVSQRMYHTSISTTVSEEMMLTNLIFPDNKRLPIYRKKYEESMMLNKKISDGLNVKILDLSTREKNWIAPQARAKKQHNS